MNRESIRSPLAIIISSGTELTKGLFTDKNSGWLSSELEKIGVKTKKHITVLDNLQDLTDIFFDSMHEADIVLCTGGLGPTQDDLTRQAASVVFGLPLVIDEVSLKMMEERFSKRGIPMPETNRCQAYIPEGSIPLRNNHGTASGFMIHDKGRCKIFAAMPGPPRELHPMFEEDVSPFIKTNFSISKNIRTLTFHTIGLPESLADSMISDLYKSDDYELTILSGLGTVDIIFSIPYSNENTLSSIEARIEGEISARIPKDNLYGRNDETLESIVAESYTRLGLTIATAESCTGGLIGKRLTDIPGSSKYYMQGFITYSNESKISALKVDGKIIERFGAVSAETAAAMAEGAKKQSGADVAVSSTGIAGPDGGSAEKPVGLVFLGFSDGIKTITERHIFLGKRNDIRMRASLQALDILRKYVVEKAKK